MNEITNSQTVHSKSRPKSLVNNDNIWQTKQGAVVIPEDDENLLIRICIIGHTTAAGHRGHTAAEATRRQKFWRKTISEDIYNWRR